MEKDSIIILDGFVENLDIDKNCELCHYHIPEFISHHFEGDEIDGDVCKFSKHGSINGHSLDDKLSSLVETFDEWRWEEKESNCGIDNPEYEIPVLIANICPLYIKKDKE